MTALAQDRATERRQGLTVDYQVINADVIYAGSLVCVNAAGYALPGANTLGNIFVGVAEGRADNSAGAAGAIRVVVARKGLYRFASASSLSIANVGDNVYVVDDQTVGLIAQANQGIYCGVIAKVEGANDCWVDIEVASRQVDVTSDLAEIVTDLTTAKESIVVPMPVITSAGAALAAFSDGATPTMGFCVTAKGMGIRWNNHATPGAVAAKVVIPADADVTADMVLHLLAAKTGATLGDATKFTVGAYNNAVGAAYDADGDFGGDTTAMVGNATAKTVQHVTLTLALADLAAYPAALELTLKPKDGTLGTDDVILLGSWIEYTRKMLTA